MLFPDYVTNLQNSQVKGGEMSLEATSAPVRRSGPYSQYLL